MASGCDLKLVPSPFPDGMWAVRAREDDLDVFE